MAVGRRGYVGYSKFLVVIGLIFIFNLKLFAANVINLRNITYSQLNREFQLTNKTLRSATSANNNALRLVNEHSDANNIVHKRMQQFYNGIPVFGGNAVIHQGNTISMNGILYNDLEKDLKSHSQNYLHNTDAALEKFKEKYRGNLLSEETISPIIFIDRDQHAYWAYKVSLLVTYLNKIPERPSAILEAKTFRTFVEWNDIKTSFSPVNGKGFGGNLRTGKYEYGKNFPYLPISRDEIAQICLMENPDVKVVDMVHRYSGPNAAMRFKCEESDSLPYWTGYNADGYDFENGAYSPVNDALYAGQIVKNMYKNWFDLDVLSMKNGSPMQLIMRVHFGQGYNNAFWDGKQMTFGDGDDEVYPLVSVAVGAHEISHGFTEQYSDLEYFGQSGGINESFSDMAAQAAEFYSQGKNSWQIGSDIMKSGAIRYMENPEQDGGSIGNAKDYKDDLNVHYSSGVFNRLFYILTNKPGWNIKKTFTVMIKANMDYWTSTTSFAEAACGIIHAADDLNYSIDDINLALNDVGIDVHPLC